MQAVEQSTSDSAVASLAVDHLRHCLASARGGEQLRAIWGLAFSLRDAVGPSDPNHRDLQEIGSEAMGRCVQLTLRAHKSAHRLSIPTAVKRAAADRSCFYCGRSGEPLEYDHVLCVSAGGEDKIDNIVAACRTCNRRKGASDLVAFLAAERVRRWADAEAMAFEADHLDQLYDALIAERPPDDPPL